METSFNKLLDEDYFRKINLESTYITQCYRAAAIITKDNGIAYLDKFVVADAAKGEGLGKALWQKVRVNNDRLFWRCKPDNTINGFYFSHCDGCFKTEQWNIFWYGIDDFKIVENCIQFALNKVTTLN